MTVSRASVRRGWPEVIEVLRGELFGTHPTRPEREVEDHVGPLGNELQQPWPQTSLNLIADVLGSGTVEIPRRHISTSKESRTMPSLSKRCAYVDFPDPEGPHVAGRRQLANANVACERVVADQGQLDCSRLMPELDGPFGRIDRGVDESNQVRELVSRSHGVGLGQVPT